MTGVERTEILSGHCTHFQSTPRQAAKSTVFQHSQWLSAAFPQPAPYSGTPLQGKASLKYALASGVNAAPIISQKFATEARALVDSIGFNSAGTLHIPAGGVREPASILCGKGTYLSLTS